MNCEQDQGITLIALVISIVVLVILAGVSVNLLFGNDGIITKAREGADDYRSAEQAEQEQLSELTNTMNSLIPEVTRLPDLPEETIATRSMITKWNIASGQKIRIAVYPDKDYYGNTIENDTNFIVNWGDGTQETITSANLQYAYWGDDKTKGYIEHTYNSSNSEMLVTIDGICRDFSCSDGSENLIEVVQWGSTGLIELSFAFCESLNQIAIPTRNSFKDVISFHNTFFFCTNLMAIPENLFANCSNVIDFTGIFTRCIALTTIPENLFANCTNVINFTQTFNRCDALTTIPENLFANCPNVIDFNNTFSECTNLTTIPENLFANCLKVEDFYATFYGCYNLTGAVPNLWERIPNGAENEYYGVPDGYACFGGCTQLDNYINIPQRWRDSIPV